MEARSSRHSDAVIKGMRKGHGLRRLLVDLLCCPECRSFPLRLTVFAEESTSPVGRRSCERFCGVTGEALNGSNGGCTRCLHDDVSSGFLRCSSCERVYFIKDGIPRLLAEQFGELVDWSFADENSDRFGPAMADVDRMRKRAAEEGVVEDVAWALEDVAYWEADIYADPKRTAAHLASVEKQRPDAGNRALPREISIFGHLRSHLRGGVLLDVGCGVAQTVRLLLPPEENDYVYVGAELSISALETNRATLKGDFVQCSGDRLPFREASLDAAITLGTLHHLREGGGTLVRLLECLKPGGLIGIDEVISRSKRSRRLPIFQRLRSHESAHNESIEMSVVDSALEGRADVVTRKLRYSPVRWVLARFLSNSMRSRPWLSRLVLALDTATIQTLGRLTSLFGPRELLLLAKRRSD